MDQQSKRIIRKYSLAFKKQIVKEYEALTTAVIDAHGLGK